MKIQKVRVNDAKEGFFDIVTGGRIYHLQVCEPDVNASEQELQSCNVNYWITGFTLWLEYVEKEKNRFNNPLPQNSARGTKQTL